SCGKILVPISMCNYCKEHVSWICNKCQRVEDVSHKHDRAHDPKNTNLDTKNSIKNGIMHLVSNGK
ncbi:MAG TPA: hypothetical protein VE548_16155, partial [Nitrososphaeraceae archaeon]|nr:hypothetical protein [Nitrososphaeraceae archaeon]